MYVQHLIHFCLYPLAAADEGADSNRAGQSHGRPKLRGAVKDCVRFFFVCVPHVDFCVFGPCSK